MSRVRYGHKLTKFQNQFSLRLAKIVFGHLVLVLVFTFSQPWERGRAKPANFMTNYGKKTRQSNPFESKPLHKRIRTTLPKKLQ
jgi:hypothetical protein